MRRKVLMMSDLQSAAEEIEIVDAATYDADLARVTAERDSNKRLHDGCLELYRRAVENLTAAEAERDAARRDLRLCRGHDIMAKFRMIAAERDDLLDKLIAERTKADRARESLKLNRQYAVNSSLKEGHLRQLIIRSSDKALAPAQDDAAKGEA